MNEYLRRIDERDYLTEREHRQFLDKLKQDLEILEILKPHIKITSDGIISCHNLVLLPRCKYYEKEYNKVKKWLEGEK